MKKKIFFLPSVIFGVQQEIGANDRDANGNNRQDHCDQQHKSVDVINFVGPKRREYEVPKNKLINKNNKKQKTN